MNEKIDFVATAPSGYWLVVMLLSKLDILKKRRMMGG